MKRAHPAGLVALAGLAPLVMALARPAPRLPSPLPLTGDVITLPMLNDRNGRVALSGVRAIEEGALYTGSALPVSYDAQKPEGGIERMYPDETAFNFLRDKNVRLVVSLQTDEPAFREAEGYLQYWKDQTGYAIDTRWLPVPPQHIYALSDQSAMRAAAELISDLKRNWPMSGAVYLHGGDGHEAPAVVVAAYEVWRNRGWAEPDVLWPQIEQRFMRAADPDGDAAGDGSRLLAFRALRRRMEYLGEL